MAPAEAPQQSLEPTHRRSPSPHRGPGGRHRGRNYDDPGRDYRATYRRSYHTPERYDEPRSEKRASGGPAPATQGSDCAPARRDDHPRPGTPNTAPERVPHGRRDDTDRRPRRSPSTNTARRLHYDASDTKRPSDWEPTTAPHTRPPDMTQDEPPRKRQRGHNKGRRTVTQPSTATLHRPLTHALTGTQTTPVLVAPHPQVTQSPRAGNPQIP